MAVWDKALFDSLYSLPGWSTGIRDATRVPMFHYNWFAMQPEINNIITMYLGMPGFAQLSDIAIVGGGYGWTAEALEAQGINVVVVDTSPHIIGTLNVSEEQELRDTLAADGWDPDNLPVFIGPDWNTPVDPWAFWLRPDNVRSAATVLDEDLSTAGSRRNVRNALPSNMDGILTEYALDSQESEADALVLIERCEQLRPNPNCNVIHLVSGSSVPPFISYTKEEWRGLLDANGYNHWVVDSAGTVLQPGG